MRKVWLEYLRVKYQTIASDIEAIDDFGQHVDIEINNFGDTTNDRLAKYVSLLPDSQRILIQLRHYQNMTPKEITEELSKDMNYVKVTYKRALKSLRRMIEDPQLFYEQKGVD